MQKTLNEDEVTSLRFKRDHVFRLNSKNEEIAPFLVFLPDLKRVLLDCSTEFTEPEDFSDSIKSLTELSGISIEGLDAKNMKVDLKPLQKLQFVGFYECQNINLEALNSLQITNFVLHESTVVESKKDKILVPKLLHIELRGESVTYEKYVKKIFPKAKIHPKKGLRKRRIKTLFPKKIKTSQPKLKPHTI